MGDGLGQHWRGCPGCHFREGHVMSWLRKCDNCPEGDGTLHTFRDAGKPVAWFTGVLFPWVCSWTDGDTSTIPWTGESGKKCFATMSLGEGGTVGATFPTTTCSSSTARSLTAR